MSASRPVERGSASAAGRQVAQESCEAARRLAIRAVAGYAAPSAAVINGSTTDSPSPASAVVAASTVPVFVPERAPMRAATPGAPRRARARAADSPPRRWGPSRPR